MRDFASTAAMNVLNISLSLLAIAAGMMDALSYLRLNHVFTSAMTGNTVLLGLALGQLQLAAALHSSVAFGGFVVGLAVGALLLGRESQPGRWSRGVNAALAVELLCLAGFSAMWLMSADPRSGLLLHALILLAAIGMGVQSAAVHRLHVPDLSTTFFTGTLTGIVTSAVDFVSPRRAAERPAKTLRQLVILGIYVSGAVVAGVMTAHGMEVVGVLPLAAVLVVLAWHLVLG